MKDTPWINAEKVLPEEKTRVIVCTKTKKGVMNINIAYHSDGMWHGNGSMSGVIAWKPLPDFPEWDDDKAVKEWNGRAETVKDQPDGDVVEVVRCKDCKFWDAVKNPKHAGKGICTPPNRSLGGYCTRRGATLQDDYCSFGERKEGDGE